MIDADELKWLGVSPTLEKYASKASGSSAASIALHAAMSRGKASHGQRPASRAGAPVEPVRAPLPTVDVQAERKSAVTAERQRWTSVFASEASKGRERHAATLLGCSDGFSAANIITALAKGPTDAERDRAKAAEKTKAAGASWDRVLDRMTANGR